MSKINILVVSPDTFGTGNFRFIEPHLDLQKQFPDDFYVDITLEAPDWDDVNSTSKFDIIIGNKSMIGVDKAEETFTRLREQGKVIIMDIDDYWEVTKNHPQHDVAKEIKYKEKMLLLMSKVDHITTTTDYFANEIRKTNENVIVFPNAIDPSNKKYKISETESDKLRFGYLSGSSHYHDVKLLEKSLSSINNKYSDKVQIVLCGFDDRGTVQDRNANGEMFERPASLKETPYFHYEKILTSGFTKLDEVYKNWLQGYKKGEYPNDVNLSYRRIWTRPFSTYALGYNEMDISLAPLVLDKFNLMKSQLKVIEAGFFKKPIICSDIAPYQIDIKHGVNGFLVNDKSQNKNWAYYMKKFIENPNLVKDMGEALYETVKDKYNLKEITKSRAEWYKTLIKK